MTGSPFDRMTAALGAAFARIVGLLLEFWTGSAGTSSAAAGAGITADLAPYTASLTVTTATIGVMIAGTRMAVSSSRAQEPARDLVRGLAVLTLVWWGGAFGLRTLADASDEAARHVLGSTGVGAGSVGHLDAVLATLAITDAGLVFLICLVGALSGLAQFLLLLMREPALALLAGALPVTAGASLAGVGTAYLKRVLAWAIALAGYSFVAAVVYAAAFAAIGTSSDLSDVISGIALIAVAVAALPVLVRLIAPALQATLAGRAGDPVPTPDLASGALLLGGRVRPTAAGGPPSDAGPQVRPGLVPTGSDLAALGGGRRPGFSSLPALEPAVRPATRSTTTAVRGRSDDPADDGQRGEDQ